MGWSSLGKQLAVAVGSKSVHSLPAWGLHLRGRPSTRPGLCITPLQGTQDVAGFVEGTGSGSLNPVFSAGDSQTHLIVACSNNNKTDENN